MSPAKITVRIDGWPKLRKMLEESGPFWALPWTDALGEASEVAKKALQLYAPGASGQGVKTAMQKRPVPLWARARMPAMTRGKSRSGQPFRVLGALHGSKRIKYHFTTGPWRGQLTYGWFDKARDVVLGKIYSLLSAAEKEMEKRFHL